MHYVYIIRSLIDGTFYKGYTLDYIARLTAHNSGSSRYTSKKLPWELVYVEAFESKTVALQREKQLKRCNTQYLKWLLDQPSNILKK